MVQNLFACELFSSYHLIWRTLIWQIPTVKLDSRPVKIRKGKEDRSLLKLARKKIQKHVGDLAVRATLCLYNYSVLVLIAVGL